MPRREIPAPPPPRAAPLGVQLRVLFGGTYTTWGWGFLLFSMIFFWGFSARCEAITLLEFVGSKKTTHGEVIRVSETGNSENNEALWSVRYRYQIDNHDYEGESFDFDPQLDPGDKTQVTYLEHSPAKSRITGMRRRPFGAPVFFVTLFPLGALLIILKSLIRGLRDRRLLKIGHVGYARLISQEDTNARVNNEAVYKLTYEMMLPRTNQPANYRQQWAQWAETHHFHHKTHEPDRLLDESEEPVLYNPEKPGEASLIDAMPGEVSFDATGQLHSTSCLKVAILPILTVLIHGSVGVLMLV